MSSNLINFERTMRLDSPIFTEDKLRDEINEILRKSKDELVRIVKKNMKDSVPSGTTRRKRNITRPFRKRDKQLFIESEEFQLGSGKYKVKKAQRFLRVDRNSKNKRQITGAAFYRQSAKGQAPAIVSGSLYNSIRGEVIGSEGFTVGAKGQGAKAKNLDNPLGLNRPFLTEIGRKYKREIFIPKIQAKINQLVS